MIVTRRNLAALALAAPLAVPSIVKLAAAGQSDGEAQDWPAWAPARSDLYAQNAKALREKGEDLRAFGARLDGVFDDTDAFQRALYSASVIAIGGGDRAVVRITRQLQVRRPVSIIGFGPRPLVKAECAEKDLFLICPPEDDPSHFLGPIRIDNLRFERPEPLAPHGTVVRGYNLRGIAITRCSARRMGIIALRHTRQRLGLYRRSQGSISLDPALAAGFSGDAPHDLCEDLLVFDCDVDAVTHASHLVRFEFTRRVAIAHNRGRFCGISWWGGGARRKEGGDLAHMRRARDIYVCDNDVSGSIAGIWGNNGQTIHVARNRVAMVTDVGIDFEGCVDVLARDNVVLNAGNFCYATFYAARNVVFENNVGVQDGSATQIHLKYGARPIGTVQGRTLLALRSAGFGQVRGAIAVAYRNNHLSWRGQAGLGNCLPSYFDTLELSANQFENVECDLRYRLTRSLAIRGNRFMFDRSLDKIVEVIGASADTFEIADNEIRAGGPFQRGSAAIIAEAGQGAGPWEIVRNRIAAAGDLPLVVDGGPSAERMKITDNTGADIVMPADANVDLRNNRGPGRGAATILRPNKAETSSAPAH
ncbi:right-handed parallel beta-helix repeat-containing protein [Novosphingobium album (ex Liu et al. 2023)]|uniref:Right-handed parallel beta-helix repeat-containing protein n=1 Tax=Novosphingobium album (ex Liu et al. 2023) TaxID=3031130 RepID=A0ABT5WTH0_9SPHN|nr:right-handed parallel beta-helix repeat-containing protein [Novosphingobium album (ex Liu et al. 2023)]MDE8653181.1 right-handed parallel beta-helix repeat-containing protein [Novosphingobium album (ex Liu et al. 2023)]